MALDQPHRFLFSVPAPGHEKEHTSGQLTIKVAHNAAEERGATAHARLPPPPGTPPVGRQRPKHASVFRSMPPTTPPTPMARGRSTKSCSQPRQLTALDQPHRFWFSVPAPGHEKGHTSGQLTIKAVHNAAEEREATAHAMLPPPPGITPFGRKGLNYSMSSI